jgi:hypothetical protein
MLYFIVIWISVSAVILATSWYASTVLKQYWPEWWQRVVVDMDPAYKAYDSRFTAHASGQRRVPR